MRSVFLLEDEPVNILCVFSKSLRTGADGECNSMPIIKPMPRTSFMPSTCFSAQ